MYIYLKRIFDLILSLILLPIVVLLTILIGFFIKLEDNGPLFYMSDRIGKNGNIFKMYKLRSMKVDAPEKRLEDGSTFIGENDDRVTRVGKFVRKTSLDEIPQLYNIFKGDMSFIGPRPDSAMYLSKYTDEERIILTVRPGITGYNQAINRNSVGTKDKLLNDIFYVKNMGFIFDMKIILLTIKTVVKGENIERG